MKKLQKSCLSFVLAIALTVVSLWTGNVDVKAEVTKETQKSMEITEDNINAHAYETYYYSDDITYTYKGNAVEFISESQFTAGGETYDMKNKKTTVTVEEAEDGTVTISLSNVTQPVSSISGAWNTSFGGATYLVYQTDISGMEEVRSASATSLKNTITLENLSAGVYHLTGGTIYEKANPYSSGYDFGDGNGKVTEGYFGTLPDITFTVEGEEEEVYLGVETEAKVYEDFENDIWLQYQQKELEIGDTATIYPWRMEQIITSQTGNDVARPNFNFEIIKGEDVIQLDAVRSTDDTTVLEEGAVDEAEVTALSQGTAVVQVTYDARDYKGQHWDACSDVNTAYVVFTVGETGTATISTNDEFANWRHYDTIYYNEGETTPYTFTVDTENADSVKVTVNGIAIEGEGNKYTANLENRSNIIGIEAVDKDGNKTSMYRVIDARWIKINIENITGDPEVYRQGDELKVSFEGVTMPVYKLATIYNPQFGSNAAYIAYSSSLGDFKGQCSQWDLATQNSFRISLEKARKGDYVFTSDGIHCAWWGDELGSDMVKTGAGSPNLNAASVSDIFSVMPSFTISVENALVDPEISLDSTEKTLYEGQQYQLTASGYDEEETVTWTTSDASVVKVDKDGTVTAVKEGTATITAKVGEKEASCLITVKEGEDPITTITITKTDKYNAVARKSIFEADVTGADEADKSVVWRVSNPDEAVIVGTGVTEEGKPYAEVIVTKKTSDLEIICIAKEGATTATYAFPITNSEYIQFGTALCFDLNDVDSKTIDGLTLADALQVQTLRKIYDSQTESWQKAVTSQYSGYWEKFLAAEEKIEFLQAKEDAKQELANYKDMTAYREEQQKELDKLISDAKEAIETAEDLQEVYRILNETEEKMDEVKTDAQLKEEEVAAKPEEKPSTEAPSTTTPNPSVVNPSASQAKAALAKPNLKKARGLKKSVRLQWKKVKKAQYYQIYRATSKKGVYKRIKTVSKKKLVYIDKKVKRNKKYFYRIRAYKVVNGTKVYSPWSKRLSVKIK